MLGSISQSSARQHRILNCAAHALLVLALLALLLAPAHLALGHLGRTPLQPAQIVGSLAIVALLLTLPILMPARWALVWMTLALVTMLAVRLLFYGLVQFSGSGFTDEVFIHLEWTSVRVAWEQYRALCLALLVLLACVPLLTLALVRRAPRIRRRIGVAGALIALACIIVARQGLPEWMLVTATHAWHQPKRLDVSESELQRWHDSGVIELNLPRKSLIQASPPDRPRNLILIYLESVGIRVIDHPHYPGLMPHLARRVRSHSHVPNLHASGHITIEGITNSQCGTLLPFERDNESLAGSDGMAEDQPCLGDVLSRAGYTQSYLGGAETSFAGKGSFLAAHGYDRIMGLAQWRELGLAPRRGGWGLGDPDLFEQARIELERLRADDRPFNLTLLTIGTHLPGFTYEECTPYGSDEPFIESLHCTDQLLERWLGDLENAGYLDDTLIVITADHHVFPNPLMRQLFGDDAIADRRLPLLTLGAGASQQAATETGASYDLAPTILDLLGIEHDARFALGRSLLRPEARRDYFPSRYRDVYAGRSALPPVGECSPGTPELPLSKCDKDALMTLLRMQNAAFSQAVTSALDCRHATRTRIRIPHSDDSAMQFLVDGHDHGTRFTWRSRAVPASQPGLYVASFSAEGVLNERRFVPENEVATFRPMPASADVGGMLIAWRGRADGDAPPAWLLDSTNGQPSIRAAAVAVDAHGHVHPLSRHHLPDAAEFLLETSTCHHLLR